MRLSETTKVWFTVVEPVTPRNTWMPRMVPLLVRLRLRVGAAPEAAVLYTLMTGPIAT